MTDQHDPADPVKKSVSILFVDDEEDIRFSFEDRFESRFPLYLAASGLEGIEILRSEPEIGVVITDIRMPEMNGFELIRQARKLNPDLGFIVVSGHGDTEDIIEALRLGARNYLRKPYEFSELEEAVRQEILKYEILKNERLLQEEEKIVDHFLTSVNELTYEMPSRMEMVIPLAFRLVRSLEAIGICDEDGRGNVALALIEIITNALEHGNLGITGEEKIALKTQGEQNYQQELTRRAEMAPYKDRVVKIVATLNEDQAIFRIEDEGQGFDYNNLPDPTDPMNLFLPSGRGILLAKTFLDEVTYQGKGNIV